MPPDPDQLKDDTVARATMIPISHRMSMLDLHTMLNRA